MQLAHSILYGNLQGGKGSENVCAGRVVRVAVAALKLKNLPTVHAYAHNNVVIDFLKLFNSCTSPHHF